MENNKESIFHCIDCGIQIKFSAGMTHELCEKCLNHFNREYSGSVAAPKEEALLKQANVYEELIETYRHENKGLVSELAAAKESIKELIPLAETGQAYYRQNAGFDWVAEREKCKALLSRAKAILDKQ